jgi:hypothetical protein
MLTETATADATQTEDDSVYCDDCGATLTAREIDQFDCQCDGCHAKTHLTCQDCKEVLELDERSSKCLTRCQPCQESRDEERLEEREEALREEARELLESICLAGGMASLKKTVATLKRLRPL